MAYLHYTKAIHYFVSLILELNYGWICVTDIFDCKYINGSKYYVIENTL